MYQELVTLLTDLIFGGTLEGTMYGQLIVEGLAAFCTLLLIMLPFIVVWRIVRRLI